MGFKSITKLECFQMVIILFICSVNIHYYGILVHFKIGMLMEITLKVSLVTAHHHYIGILENWNISELVSKFTYMIKIFKFNFQ